MKRSGRNLKIDAGDWEYLSGTTNHTWGLKPETFISIKLHSDANFQIYLINSQQETYHPLGTFEKYERNLHVTGFDSLTIKCAKSTNIATQVTASTRADLDPLDYEPVQIDAPIQDTEKMMMSLILDKKLRSLGIDPDESVNPDPDDDEDLEFFDEDPIQPPTVFEKFEIDENAQLEADLLAIDEQLPVEPITSASQQTVKPKPPAKPSEGSKDEPGE